MWGENREVLLVNSADFTSVTTSGWLGQTKLVLGSTWYHVQQSPESTTSYQIWVGMKPCQSCKEASLIESS